MRGLPRAAQLYVCVVAVGAAGLIIAGAPGRSLHWPTVVALALLHLLSESASALLAGRRVRLSAAFAVALAAVIIVGPVGAAVVGSVGAAAYHRGGLPWVKRVFNGAQFALSVFLAGTVYQLLARWAESPLDANDFPWVLVPFAAALIVHLLVNSLLVAGVLGLAEGARPWCVWCGLMASWVWPYLGYGTLGLVIAALWASMGPASAALVLVPLLVARWAFTQHAAERAAYEATIAALCQAVETKDYYTRGHCERVARASMLIAGEIGMRPARTSHLHYAGMMHDVGKLVVPTELLQKAGTLTDEELEAIRLHPARGAEIVREIDFLGEARAGIVHHHERLDGRGYPSGLAGAEIPEFARVIGVADTFDSMTSTRAYRPALSSAEAIAELRRHAGTQFDPVMVDALVRAVRKHGWRPHEPVAPPGGAALGTPRDHDDPRAPLSAGSGPA